MLDNNLEKVLKENEKGERAVMFFNELKDYLFMIRKTTVRSAFIFKIFRDEELYKHESILGPEGSFDAFCCMPGIASTPATVKWKIKIIDHFIELGMKLEEFEDLSFDRLSILKKTKDPKEWIEPARKLGVSDLRKEVLRMEKGIDSEDTEIENYIKRKSENCPYWDGIKCLKDKK